MIAASVLAAVSLVGALFAGRLGRAAARRAVAKAEADE